MAEQLYKAELIQERRSGALLAFVPEALVPNVRREGFHEVFNLALDTALEFWGGWGDQGIVKTKYHHTAEGGHFIIISTEALEADHRQVMQEARSTAYSGLGVVLGGLADRQEFPYGEFDNGGHWRGEEVYQ